jgi:hypothetical protein
MLLPTIIELSDAPGAPKVRKDLPGPMRIGDHILLDFRLNRTNGGRFEVLDVRGDFRVASVSFDATGTPRQKIQVEAKGKSPTWRAVKKPPPSRHEMAPCHHPPTKVT